MAIAIFMIFSYVFMLLVRGPVEAVVIVMIQGVFFLFKFRDKTGSKEKVKIAKAYEIERKMHPEESNSRIIEEKVRKRLMRSKLKRAGSYVGIGALLIILGAPYSNEESDWITLLCCLAILAGAILVIIGVCAFAKAMHDPLTPNESEEFAKKESIEKGGEPIYTIKESVADSNLSSSQASSSENALSQKAQDPKLNSLETEHWSNTWLDVKFCSTKDETISKQKIMEEIVSQNITPGGVSSFIIPMIFSLPMVVFLLLAIYVGWMFLIGVLGFGFFGGLFTWMAIDTEIQRRKKLKKAINKDINISFFERTCTKKQWGEYGSEHISVVYQLFFGGVNYHVSKEAYDSININDTVMFVCADGEELSIAYPLKCWDIEEK